MGVARTVWVFGDQLNRQIGALADAVPGEDRVLLVESEQLIARPRHRQRTHLVLTAMRRFAAELADEGFDVDLRRAPSLRAGLDAHRAAAAPDEVVATEPLSRRARALVADSEVRSVRSNQFLCHEDEFAAWADERTGKRLRMEDFYRWQRTRLGYLVDGDQPVGGRWNYDAENREPPPREAAPWPTPLRWDLDDVDRAVLAELDGLGFGADPEGWWPTSRAQALERLEHVVAEVLPIFGPHEDAIVERSWHLAHTLLTPALNLGLLLPGEVADAAEEAFRAGDLPVASAEGFVRQVIGWREYVWGLYWWFGPDYRERNVLDAHEPLPPAFTDPDRTAMRCVAHAAAGLRDRAWTHHIQRLMVFANLATLAGVGPEAMVDWMTDSFVDGAEWVMLPNVVGMGLHADGGQMATKPYVSGGRYLHKMSDHCAACWYRPTERVGEQACPYTTLYWDFLARHRERFGRNPRMAQAVRGLDRLGDLALVRERAVEVRRRLAAGDL
ncbi:MAG: cryptochrome/photolyase family protein [Acidimicrobiales bacterium]|nr:cryptochrome/photolyase family protein [Acidimicrobiales bacterium]